MDYTKVADRIFAIKSRDSFFAFRTFPSKFFKINADSMDNAVSTIKELVDEGFFNVPDPDHNYKGFYAMEWVMTTECNLNCPHCFARKKGEEGRYGIKNNMPLTLEELKRSVDFATMELREDIKRNNLKKGEFQIFIIGGEPLIEYKNLKEAIIYMRESLRKIEKELNIDRIEETYFLATNGLLIDEDMADFIVNNPFTVSVSIDTPINPIKIDKNAERKSNIAINGAKKLIAVGQKRLILNCVIPAEKVYELDGIMKYVEEFGIMDKVSGIQISPLTPPTRQTKFSGCRCNDEVISEWSKDTDRCKFFAKKLIEYCKRYNTDMKKYHQRVNHMLKEGGLAYRCPVSLWKWSLTPGGDIWPCHQFINIEGFKMGNIHDDFTKLKEDMAKSRAEFAKRTVFAVKPCVDCPLQACCVVFIDCPGRCFLEGGSMYNVPEHQCLMAKEYLLTILEEFIWENVEKNKLKA